MIATVLSAGTLNELELDGYCDFGFPTVSTGAAWEVGKLAATLPRVSSSKLDLRSSKLDEVPRRLLESLNRFRES